MNLTNPDEIVNPISYPWEEDFQREIIGLLLTDKYFVCQSIGLIESYYFPNETHQNIVKSVFKYFDVHKQLPSKPFVKQDLADYLKTRYSEDKLDTVKLMYFTELNTIYDYYSPFGANPIVIIDHPNAILDKIVNFAKVQAIRAAFHKCLEYIKKDPNNDSTWTKVDDTLNRARLVDRNQDLGLDYFQTIDERYKRLQEDIENCKVLTTGFLSLDNALNAGGLRVGELGGWIASAGVGKSLALVNACVKNLSKGKKVLYLTTEMDDLAVASRFDSIITGIGKHRLLNEKDNVKKGLFEYVEEFKDKQRLIIRQFPSGTSDINTIKSHHAQLKMHGFHPDLVILDYPGDLRQNAAIKTYESRYILLQELRGLGTIEGHATFIALHTNRAATNKNIEEVVNESEIGDSYKQMQVFDALWGMNQSKEEKLAGLGRVNILKHRDGSGTGSHFKIMYHYQDQSLRIEEISDNSYKNKMSITMSKIGSLVGEEFSKDKRKWKPKQEDEDVL